MLLFGFTRGGLLLLPEKCMKIDGMPGVLDSFLKPKAAAFAAAGRWNTRNWSMHQLPEGRAVQPATWLM